MKLLRNALYLGVLALLSGQSFALNCPSVGGYTVRGHNDNNTRCSYTSNKIVRLALAPQQNNCPRFILTDPNYRVVNCKLDIRLTKCVCNIVAN